MKYMGSKARIAKYILPIMEQYRTENQLWVEPFVGGANLIDKVKGARLGADSNKYLIACLKEISMGWKPQEFFTEEFYKDVKNNQEGYPQHIVGYLGFALSYGGKWFGGWCRDKAGVRNYVREASQNALKQQAYLEGIDFRVSKYQDLSIPTGSLIYCDPPYAGTTKYKDSFDSETFYQWCCDMKDRGHTVFVSEYEVIHPRFRKVWGKEMTSSLTADTGSKKATECLYLIV